MKARVGFLPTFFPLIKNVGTFCLLELPRREKWLALHEPENRIVLLSIPDGADEASTTDSFVARKNRKPSYGGARETRTLDLNTASVALFQLSYDPIAMIVY